MEDWYIIPHNKSFYCSHSKQKVRGFRFRTEDNALKYMISRVMDYPNTIKSVTLMTKRKNMHRYEMIDIYKKNSKF